MTDVTVRARCRAVLEALVRDEGITDWRALRLVQRAAYPFAVRSGWYYDTWREEVQRMYRTLGKQTPTPPEVKQHWTKGE